MYRPNFCADCGEKIVRLKWHSWTSRRFCKTCARRLRRQRIKPRVMVAVVLLGTGFVTGRLGRSAPPPLVIERSANSPLSEPSASGAASAENRPPSPGHAEDPIYICGAKTKKGPPCSRRVHGPVRCWQHKGKPSILPPEKSLVKD